MSGGSLRVLIVDESEDIRNLLGRWLTPRRYDVFHADDADSATNFLERWEVDLMIADADLLNMRGRSLIRACQRCELPFIVTVAGDLEEAVEDLKLESEKRAILLAKPFTKREILDGVLTLIGAVSFAAEPARRGRR